MTVARPRLPRRRWERPDRAAVDLRTRVGEVTLANPVMTASGTAGHGAELGGYVDLAGLGAVVVKSVSADPWPGNPPPRLYSVEGGMLNSVGSAEPGGRPPGWSRSSRRCWPPAPPWSASIWGRRAEDYQRVAARHGRGAASRGRRRGQHLLPQHRGPQPHVRPQPGRRLRRHRRGSCGAGRQPCRCGPSSAPT